MKPQVIVRASDTILSVPITQINVSPGAIDTNGNIDLTSSGVDSVFNIKDYGAKVDGTTDDTTAVTAAINAAITAGGGTVYFPSGVTKIGTLDMSAIATAANVTLQGTLGSDILLSTTAYLSLGNFGLVVCEKLAFIGTSTSAMATGNLIVLSSNVLTTFRNCAFYGLGTTGNDATYSGCILANSAPIVFEDCFFVGCAAPSSAVVTSRGGAGLRADNTIFLDVAAYKGVTYSTGAKTAGAAWVRLTLLSDVTSAGLKTGQFNNCTFDEAPLWGIRFNGTVVTRQHSATINNCHFNTGVDRGGGAYSGAIYATEMRQITVKDTTAGFSNNTTDYAVCEFNNVDVVEMDNFRGIYGASYVTFSGTTSRVKLRNCTLAGFVTYPLGWNNSAAAYIDADTAMPTTASATATAPLGATTHITGTTAITSITTTNLKAGDVLRFIFDDAVTLTEGNNLVMAGNFATGATDTWVGIYDGTNVVELSRSNN